MLFDFVTVGEVDKQTMVDRNRRVNLGWVDDDDDDEDGDDGDDDDDDDTAKIRWGWSDQLDMVGWYEWVCKT